jgi:hypothetical protein
LAGIPTYQASKDKLLFTVVFATHHVFVEQKRESCVVVPRFYYAQSEIDKNPRKTVDSKMWQAWW